ncbi:queuosine precursor transporter [Halodesulfovibrio spirochaetisodalis]|uniref:Probable queuosine precursor transporter n=1 Tax=Halodesulfovibrio spirochaetisodalis TaxID=1560234 RepID=A0A1B7XBC1_9BACT|nr:queuosine precursor transporter [Halodesulfovibrio spirochaetisodalis]OBQ46655.1 membrane protein [Halodesulfovibrio spirochaetisodalis]
MNEVLWISFAITDLCIALMLYRFFGRIGLFAVIVFNLLLCNLQVLKTVELFGLTTTLGNILYAGVFLATDMLSEFYGKREAQKGVLLGFITLVLMTVYMQVALHFSPAADDFAQPHLEAIFGFLPRVAVASMLAYLASQTHDVWAFHFWKAKTNGKMLWLRNNASTLASHVIDSGIFCLIAFYGVFPTAVLVEIMITTVLFKAFVSVLDTPFIYLAKRVHSMLPEHAH